MTRKLLIWESVKAVGRQWWFLPLVVLPLLIPPYAAQGYELRDWGTVNAYILTHPVKGYVADLYPLFQIVPLVLLVAISFAGERITRAFSAYVALSYIFIALLQNVSISEKYGLAVCTANVTLFLILASLWFWETVHPKNNFEPRQKFVTWAILLALVAFWEPINPLTLLPDFNPVYILTSGAGLSFCMVTPLYLAMLAGYFPHVNKPVFLATAFVGVMMSLGNVVLDFIIYPTYWWVGVLHLPLFIISSYSIWLSFNEIAGQVRTKVTMTHTLA